MIFSQYTETCEVLLDYPKIVGDDYIKLFIIILMYTSEDWLLSSQNMESNVLKHCNHIVQTWPLLIKVDTIGLSNKLHIKEGICYQLH